MGHRDRKQEHELALSRIGKLRREGAEARPDPDLMEIGQATGTASQTTSRTAKRDGETDDSKLEQKD
jgi:hypothetical protein